jgi:hypothetical protein
MYYTFACHPETRYGGIVATPPETQDWLDLVQLVVQWACSLLQYVDLSKPKGHARLLQMVRLTLVIAFDPRPESSPPFEPTTPPTSAHGRSMSGRNAIALNLILVHAALSVGFAVVAGKPARQLDNMAFLIIMSANNYIAIPVSTITTLGAFVYQIRSGSELVGSGTSSSNALSTRTFALQGIVFLALAVLWPYRLTLPRNLRHGDWWLVTEWYPQVGWACVNSAVFAAGSILRLYVGLGVGSEGTERLSGERQALLN